MCVGMFCEAARLEHVDLNGGDSAAIGLLDGKSCVEVECGDGLMENFGGDAGSNQCPEKHVAANAGEAIEIGDAHAPYCFMGEAAIAVAGRISFMEPER